MNQIIVFHAKINLDPFAWIIIIQVKSGQVESLIIHI